VSTPGTKGTARSAIDRPRRGPPLLIIFACVFLDMLGYGMIVPLLPFMVREGPQQALLVGLLSSLYALMQLLVAPLLGALSDRVGRRPVLVGCLFVAAGAYALLGVGANSAALPLVFLAVAIGGAAGATIPTAQAYIADRTAPEERARGLGLIGAAFGLGLMLGPASGGLLSVYGLGVPAFLAAGLALANGVFGLVSLPPEQRVATPLRAGRLVGQLGAAIAERATRPLLLAIFLLNLAFAGLQSNFPLFSSTRFGWDPVANGVFFAFVGLCAVITQGLLVGRLQPIVGEPLLVVGGLGLMALSLALTALAPAGWMLYPLVGLMALGTGLAIPSITSLVSQRAAGDRQGVVMGGMQSVLSATLVIGPALAGLLFDRVGPAAPYLSGGLLAGAAFLAAAAGLWPALRGAPVVE
jgi:MFS transporter, DHA1 family, tetracycline resistance protein